MDPLIKEDRPLWLIEAAIQLRGECIGIDTIAAKLGVAPEVVEDIVEAPGNYVLQLADF